LKSGAGLPRAALREQTSLARGVHRPSSVMVAARLAAGLPTHIEDAASARRSAAA
jgi:hypothetical protein